ncbi:MAG TPA: hypothetical protein VLA85_23380 [Verrucomicrobiae bacterium]|nr:hypothetical protein [Verrucomicrobiae bacterium]
MSWTKDLTTPYHQQDTDYYCGAAVAQMVLDSIGSGLLDQNTLYASNHAHSGPGWYTSPDGLNYTLNAYMPPPPIFNSFFIVERGDTEPEGSANIVRTLYIYGVATGSMVYQCGHWVAVRGVRTDVAPAPGATYVIQGFYINNPWPPTPSFYNPALAPPPPHSDPDACGSGGNRGVVDEYVTYSEWQSTYHTGCDVYGVGHVQFISVCDPRRPPIGTLRLAGQVRLAQGERIIAAKKALELAERGLEEHGLAAEGALAKSLSKARASEAQLVQRLDRPDDFYYLVTLRRGKTATAVARIDALHGTFQGVHALSGARHSPIIDREAALQAARANLIDLEDGRGRIPLREGAFCLYPTLVWRPCRESRSPYYPFHQITVGGSIIYISYDGRVYPALHDLGRG